MGKFFVIYTSPNNPIVPKDKQFDSLAAAQSWVKAFQEKFGTSWKCRIEQEVA